MAAKEPLRVLVTGAAGQIAYSLLAMIGQGHMFGADQPVILHLLDIAPAADKIKGVEMELQDAAYKLVVGVVGTTDEAVAFKDIDYCVMLGAFPRRKGMERADLLKKNAAIFQTQGKSLDTYAKKTVKVLVVGNPANTNALIAMECAPSIPKENFSALTRLDHNRAKAQLALRVGASPEAVDGVIIWGNHSSTQYPDASHATIGGESVAAKVNDDAWLKGDFIPTVQKRGAAIIAARGLSSAMSAAKAAVDHVHDWHLGTPEGKYVSMAIHATGAYGVKEGVIFSYPVTIKDGKVSVVEGLAIDEFSQEKLNVTEKELRDERETAFAFLAESK